MAGLAGLQPATMEFGIQRWVVSQNCRYFLRSSICNFCILASTSGVPLFRKTSSYALHLTCLAIMLGSMVRKTAHFGIMEKKMDTTGIIEVL